MDMAKRRKLIYWILSACLVLTYLLFRGSDWHSSLELHTFMEGIATLLAMVVGIMALIRYWARADNMFLLLGAGFLGTAVLDGFHTIITSAYFQPWMPSDSQSLISWSWMASRQFLSILVLMSFLAYRREQTIGVDGHLNETVVYLSVGTFSLACLLFFITVPLPRAYYPEFLIHRPAEFGPAIFFIAALIGYLKMGMWKRDAFNHWLILFLIVGVASQTLLTPMSNILFDLEFDTAHLAKIISYLLVLIGLMINMFVIFVRERQVGERNSAIVDHIFDGIITIDSRGTVRSVNAAVSNIFGYKDYEILGQNISMLAASPHREVHDSYLHNYLTTGTPKIIGTGREVEGMRQDGDIFPMELQVTELWAADRLMFLGVIRDISERHAADRMKTEFISTVSHELRTPLTAIRGSLGMIGSGALLKPEQSQRMIELATKNTDRLIDLVNDLLDLEKMQLGKMEFEFEKSDLNNMLDRAVEMNQPYATEKGAQLEITDAVEEAYVSADSQRLDQVMANLISNAAKFSPEGAKVELALSRQNRGFRVSVRDHGAGIPLEFQERIYDKFTQADSSDTRKQGGTGLGLNITKMIVEQHGGEIGFVSEQGKGTTFYFEIDEIQSSAEIEIKKDQPEIPGAAPRQRILILEDDIDASRKLSELLQKEGYLTDIARSAEEAKISIKQNHYDAMTVDIMLPDGDGIALIHELRGQEETQYLATIVVSVRPDNRNKDVNTAALGIVDWLQKPVDQERLLRAVDIAVMRPQRKATQGKKRILYVEDDIDLIGILSSALSDSIEIVSATTLAAARKMISEQSFDLLVLDVGLPDGSGLDLLSTLHQEQGAPIPVIVYSASELDRSVRDQVEAALVKSRSSNDDLINTITALLPVPLVEQNKEESE